MPISSIRKVVSSKRNWLASNNIKSGLTTPFLETNHSRHRVHRADHKRKQRDKGGDKCGFGITCLAMAQDLCMKLQRFLAAFPPTGLGQPQKDCPKLTNLCVEKFK
jgi:hypothetical protein